MIHEQSAVSGFHAQDSLVATRTGTTGCERQRVVRCSWRDFEAASGNGSGEDGARIRLGAEHAFLEVRDVEVATRRVNDFARLREETSAGLADRFPGDTLQPLLRAYYMLRHLMCREQRWRPLC